MPSIITKQSINEQSTIDSVNALFRELRQNKIQQNDNNPMSYMNDTVSSRHRSTVNSTASASVTSQSSRAEKPRAKLRDKDFRDRVLWPRGITFPSNFEASNVFAHFGTEKPSEGHRSLKSLRHTKACIDATDEDKNEAIEEYICIDHYGLAEAEYADVSRKRFLLGDPRYLSFGKARQWMVERTLEQVLKPGTTANSRWRPPPLIGTGGASHPEYDFDVRPDCQYWISVRSFNEDYLRLFSRYVYVHQGRITTPYFTVEFKKDGKSMEMAQNQIAAAASMTLYNRCLLKVERLKATGRKWTNEHTASLKHYGLTLEGSSYTFWCVKLKPIEGPVSADAWTWPGCDIIEASIGTMLTKSSVTHFIDWVNEIHRWGLSVHGPSCQEDVQVCIEKLEKVRTSLRPDGPDDEDTLG